MNIFSAEMTDYDPEGTAILWQKPVESLRSEFLQKFVDLCESNQIEAYHGRPTTPLRSIAPGNTPEHNKLLTILGDPRPFTPASSTQEHTQG